MSFGNRDDGSNAYVVRHALNILATQLRLYCWRDRIFDGQIFHLENVAFVSYLVATKATTSKKPILRDWVPKYGNNPIVRRWSGQGIWGRHW